MSIRQVFLKAEIFVSISKFRTARLGWPICPLFQIGNFRFNRNFHSHRQILATKKLTSGRQDTEHLQLPKPNQAGTETGESESVSKTSPTFHYFQSPSSSAVSVVRPVAAVPEEQGPFLAPDEQQRAATGDRPRLKKTLKKQPSGKTGDTTIPGSSAEEKRISEIRKKKNSQL